MTSCWDHIFQAGQAFDVCEWNIIGTGENCKVCPSYIFMKMKYVHMYFISSFCSVFAGDVSSLCNFLHGRTCIHQSSKWQAIYFASSFKMAGDVFLSKRQAIYCYIILKTSKWQAMYDGEECSVGKATVVAADEECKVRSHCNCNCGCFCCFLLESSFDIKQCTADSK